MLITVPACQIAAFAHGIAYSYRLHEPFFETVLGRIFFDMVSVAVLAVTGNGDSHLSFDGLDMVQE